MYLEDNERCCGGHTEIVFPNFSCQFFLIGNPLLTSKVNVIINVLDVNEFPPEISVPYETSVCENAKPGQVF